MDFQLPPKRPPGVAPACRCEGRSPGAELLDPDLERKRIELRLSHLVAAEASAWRSFAKATAAGIVAVLLIPAGSFVAGTAIGSHLPSPRSPGVALIGFAMQGGGSFLMIVLVIPIVRRFARWIEAIWRRRRFSKG